MQRENLCALVIWQALSILTDMVNAGDTIRNHSAPLGQSLGTVLRDVGIADLKLSVVYTGCETCFILNQAKQASI